MHGAGWGMRSSSARRGCDRLGPVTVLPLWPRSGLWDAGCWCCGCCAVNPGSGRGAGGTWFPRGCVAGMAPGLWLPPQVLSGLQLWDYF